MSNDETPGNATGGVIPIGTDGTATEEHPHEGKLACGFDAGGIILPPGLVLLRNDTGRTLGPDELHLLTYVGPIPHGADPQAYARLMSFRAGERIYTRADVERYATETTRRFLDEIASGDSVNEGRAVPASPTAVEVTDPPAGTNTVTFGFDGTATGDTALVAVDAEGRMVAW